MIAAERYLQYHPNRNIVASEAIRFGGGLSTGLLMPHEGRFRLTLFRDGRVDGCFESDSFARLYRVFRMTMRLWLNMKSREGSL